MPRSSHPPTLLTLLQRTLTQEKPLAPGGAVLVAVSGGPDSQALLHALVKVTKGKVRIAAHGVDHGLREAAAKELDLAESLANDLGVPFGRTRLKVAAGANLQARARTARREALLAAADAWAGPTASIATAHHADDRAETVLLALLRGASLRSLRPLPVRDGRFVRPLIRATRLAIEQHIARHRLPFARDPSNDDPRFLRTRVRRDVLPLLCSLDPQIVQHLNTLATEVDETLAHTAEPAALDPVALTLEALRLPAKTSHRSRRALGEAIRSRAHEAQVFLPGGLVARFDRQHVQWVVVPREANDDDFGRDRSGLGTRDH